MNDKTYGKHLPFIKFRAVLSIMPIEYYLLFINQFPIFKKAFYLSFSTKVFLGAKSLFIMNWNAAKWNYYFVDCMQYLLESNPLRGIKLDSLMFTLFCFKAVVYNNEPLSQVFLPVAMIFLSF